MLTVRATKIGQHSLTLSSYVKVGLGKVCVCQITVLKHSYRCILVASVVVLYLSHWLCFGYTKEGSGNIMKAEVETDGAKLLKRHWSLSFPHPQAKFYLWSELNTLIKCIKPSLMHLLAALRGNYLGNGDCCTWIFYRAFFAFSWNTIPTKIPACLKIASLSLFWVEILLPNFVKQASEGQERFGLET